MESTDVRVLRLPAMRVASAYGFGSSPEEMAWEKLLTWAREQGLLENRGTRFFGFNNPSPSPGSPNYGYEQWMTVNADTQPSGEIKIREFDGGLYAIARCKLPQIGEAWQNLVKWCEQSPYAIAHHQWLEEGLSAPGTSFDDFIMDIYLPIAE
ncbi:MAG: GyrI-like domain-containing protein [Anaerolineae bacterium]|nr:GyrI-like domain-containing protein [Anaerolineae bacterium]